jgi:hypothetical protein
VPDPNDDPVVQYLAALEARRDAPPDFPQPDRLAENLASAPMMQPAEDPEGLREELAANTPGSEANVERLEDGFVSAAADYGRRHGMGYEAWIQAGVDPEVLRRAGIAPDRD